MKIVHIAPNAPYNDYWGYQDNLLPKYHKKLGHDVTVIVTNTMHKDGKIIETDCGEYFIEDGEKIIRLKRKKYLSRILTSLNAKLEVFDLLNELRPDLVFYHGLVSSTIYDVIKYKKKINSKCVIIQDNHLDYNIGRNCKNLMEYIIREFYRHVNKKSVKYVSKVYGVTPWRKKYAEEYFKIPKDKTDVLIMGADDEKIDFKNKEKIRNDIRKKYNISDDDFLVVTGGKIDKRKKIDILMKSCVNMEDIKLLVFGSISDDVKDEFDAIIKKNDNINYIGWINSDDVYNYFFAADLVFFPGQHSVLWEQACASKVPCVFEKWDEMDHINNGGNSDFVYPVTEENIREKLLELKFTDKYKKMKEVALSEKTDIYLYSNIAKKSLECIEKK